MLVAGGFCYRMLVDESCIVRESQNSPAPARASDRLLSGNLHAKHGIVPTLPWPTSVGWC
jgi:hypothetical protein